MFKVNDEVILKNGDVYGYLLEYLEDIDKWLMYTCFNSVMYVNDHDITHTKLLTRADVAD